MGVYWNWTFNVVVSVQQIQVLWNFLSVGSYLFFPLYFQYNIFNTRLWSLWIRSTNSTFQYTFLRSLRPWVPQRDALVCSHRHMRTWDISIFMQGFSKPREIIFNHKPFCSFLNSAWIWSTVLVEYATCLQEATCFSVDYFMRGQKKSWIWKIRVMLDTKNDLLMLNRLSEARQEWSRELNALVRHFS